MMRRTFAMCGVLLWLLAPSGVRAEPRPFDFSSAGRSARLLERPGALPRGGTSASWGHARAFASSTTVTVTDDLGIPTHLWLVPLILTGVGLVAGVTVCGFLGEDPDDDYCQVALLTGLGLGAALGLGYALVAGCIEAGCSDSCTEGDEGCEATFQARRRMQRAAQHLGPRQRRTPLALPLGLTPMVGHANDRTVLGLGGHF